MLLSNQIILLLYFSLPFIQRKSSLESPLEHGSGTTAQNQSNCSKGRYISPRSLENLPTVANFKILNVIGIKFWRDQTLVRLGSLRGLIS